VTNLPLTPGTKVCDRDGRWYTIERVSDYWYDARDIEDNGSYLIYPSHITTVEEDEDAPADS